MEDLLDLYAEPDQSAYPVVCFDEIPYQFVSEKRQPLLLQPGKAIRYEYEYQREGTCNRFMFLEPLAGWRHAWQRMHQVQPESVIGQKLTQDFLTMIRQRQPDELSP